MEIHANRKKVAGEVTQVPEVVLQPFLTTKMKGLIEVRFVAAGKRPSCPFWAVSSIKDTHFCQQMEGHKQTDFLIWFPHHRGVADDVGEENGGEAVGGHGSREWVVSNQLSELSTS